MRKMEAWLVGLLLIAVALPLPMAAFDPAGLAGLTGLAAGACDDGSAHLAMGCASILL
jgi:hypothetical protein